mgnify:CR=1 FL=1
MTSTQSPVPGEAPAGPLLSVRGLRLAYKGATTLAVAGVSFDVYPGEQVAIVGESGSGKTSVAKSIVDLLPSSTDVRADALRYDGLDLTAEPLAAACIEQPAARLRQALQHLVGPGDHRGVETARVRRQRRQRR